MFKYSEDGALNDIIFIDFQLMYYGSPAMDVAYFMAASATGKMKKEYKDHILTFYHTTFMLSLEKLGITADYSYEDFLEDYKKALIWGMNFAVTTVPQVCSENTDDIMDMEEVMKNIGNDVDEEKKKEYITKFMEKTKGMYGANSGLVERLRYVLDEAIENG